MKMNIRLTVVSGFFLSLIIILTTTIGSAQERTCKNAIGVPEVTVKLNHQVTIPPIIYFRVGLPAYPKDIARVSFDLAKRSPDRIGDKQPIAATENGTLAVDLRANVGTVILSYMISDESGLKNEISGEFIPFDQIATQSNDSGFPAPRLSNTIDPDLAVEVAGNMYDGRVVNRQAEWSYSYRNQTIPVAGIYKGRVTYVASSP